MNNKVISGNSVASPVQHEIEDSRPVPLEPWVTLRTVTRHFGMSRTTVWRNINDHGMPWRPLGAHRVRFVLSEIQEWLERTGRKRFAAIGRASALAALKRKIDSSFHGIRIQISVVPPPRPGESPILSKNSLKQSDRS